MKGSLKNRLKSLGPGILFASTAIGVSHLVQSTQAGANYGLSLLWAVIIANVLKYPFFEYGSRYANITKTSIIDGYQRIGSWAIWTYFIITVVSMFLVTAAVGFVTSGFMQNLFGINSSALTTLILFVICATILVSGKYNLLDKLVKTIGIVLVLTTLITFITVLINGNQGNQPLFSEDWLPLNDKQKMFFILGLMGWMPTAVDLSAWNSLWTIERMRQTNYHPTLKETLFDFNFGYLSSAILSICFLVMGAFILFGTDNTLPNNASGFANGIIGLYTSTLGEWAYLIIACAAFSIMFGTCIAVFDGYARAIQRTTEILIKPAKSTHKNRYSLSIMVIIAGSFLVIETFRDSAFGIKGLVNYATTLSFLIAPVIAWFNIVLVRKKYLKHHTPPLWNRLISYLGLIYLSGFSLYFIYLKFIVPD